MGGVWMPQGHDILWCFRRAWSAGSYSLKKSQENYTNLVTMLLARNPWLNSLNLKNDNEGLLDEFEIWKQVLLKTCSFVDNDLEQHKGINSFESGTAALTMVRQGNDLVVAIIGDFPKKATL